MDRLLGALVALVIGVGCGADVVSPSTGGEPDTEAPQSGGGRIGDVLGDGDGTAALADGGVAGETPSAGSGGAAGSAPDQSDAGAGGELDAAIDGGAMEPEAGSGGSAGGAAGEGGAGGPGGSGGSPEPACSASEPCLLDSIVIPTATKTLGDNADGFYATLGSTALGEPINLNTVPIVGGRVLEPSSIVIDADATDNVRAAVAYFEANGVWSGRAAICAYGSCWYVNPARIEIPDGSTITSFVAVIDPLELEADGDSTKATVGGRWEVWGY